LSSFKVNTGKSLIRIDSFAADLFCKNYPIQANFNYLF